MSRRSEPGDPAGWLTLDTYFTIQTRHLEGFRNNGFLLEENLSRRELSADLLLITGRIRCQSGLFVDVEEFLAVRVVRGRRHVRSTRYSFHAGIEGSIGRTVFRYDNHHPYLREGHADAHHKHLYDHRTWDEVTPPEWIGHDRRPFLRDVIEELRQWWETTGQFLNPGKGDDTLPPNG